MFAQNFPKAEETQLPSCTIDHVPMSWHNYLANGNREVENLHPIYGTITLANIGPAFSARTKINYF